MVSHSESSRRQARPAPCTGRRKHGLDALRRWVRTLPVTDQVVIKHSVILKTWLADGTEPELVIDSLGSAPRRDPPAPRRGAVEQAAHQGGRPDGRSETALFDCGAELFDPSALRRAVQHHAAARRDRAGHHARPGQTGAPIEGSDPPPATRKHRLAAGTRCPWPRVPRAFQFYRRPFPPRSTGA